MRKRFSLLLVLFLLTALPAWGSSWLYSTTSGDILDEKANPKPTYGITRIDFEDNKPIPTVILADDEFATAVGEFQKDSKQYIYATRVDKDKEKTDNKELTKLYAVCDPAGGVDVLADKTKYRELTLPKNQNVSVDIDLSPDDYNGLIYYIDGNDGTSTPVLTAKDAVTWTDVASTTLSKEYDAHGVVSLLPESCNFFYVWSTKREAAKTATCPYTSISSDVSVYDRSTLAHLTTFHHVRTGFDTTLQSADDEPLSYSMGRGLVVIVSDQEDIKNNKAAALVVYDDADSPAAHIVRIDESGTIPTEEVIVKSSDINGWNIDIESPMPDYDGGLYFACYSGDVNATGTKADGTDNQIDVYLWDGVSSTYTKQIGTTQNGVEIEKPFTDGGNGLYFMAERKRSQAEGGDEADALFWWNGSNDPKLIWSSDCEMEVEGEVVPKDGKNGFYFVHHTIFVNPLMTRI